MQTGTIQKSFSPSAVMVGVLLALGMSTPPAMAADTIAEALAGGTPKLDMRLRYEAVDQDNALKDAKALTLRTRLGYGTGAYKGFSVYGEFEDVSAIGDEEYSPKSAGFSTVADPEASEVNQAFLAFSGVADTTLKYGLQRIILDNARFVGNVGWRQNEQTFKAFSAVNKSLPDTTITYANLNQVHTITAGETDTDTNLINASYSGLPIGTLTAYGYFIEFPGSADSQKTLGLRFSGSRERAGGFKLLYTAEYARQSDYKDGDSDIDADYTFLELGGVMSGVTVKLGYEVLGADDHSGFETPFATKHAFNGWTDQFLATPTDGLEDIYALVTGKFMGVKLLGVYHDFSSDAGNTDYGSEWGFLAAKPFGKHYDAGFKYASYEAGDVGTGKVDTDKLWLWGTVKF
jgi:hypothetical protein